MFLEGQNWHTEHLECHKRDSKYLKGIIIHVQFLVRSFSCPIIHQISKSIYDTNNTYERGQINRKSLACIFVCRRQAPSMQCTKPISLLGNFAPSQTPQYANSLKPLLRSSPSFLHFPINQPLNELKCRILL